MNAASETPKSGFDIVKWLLVFVILSLAVVGNYLYELTALEKAIAIVVLVVIAGAVAAQTHKGRTFINFAKESRTEVRKVVWPTRQETMQTTLVVLVATLIMGLLLWGLDAILLRVVSFLTGLGI
ncbi:preprotein translocase subunit SecE [Rheinheimera aquimaris]|jgi:preprotein translocase subunit SecE|uniref:preprotein translocase subunit SecE n=1 Tax=Rheinheimera aquimaris TaxID=412437 RepID=UPI001064E250|nr:preprotein translocase subunit SecE [Rheinheimera aquimaris]MCD1600510.1 preprotein translocase subunit SecE [Rheinheimera aquimaris]|tara:strand:- start:530 stop:904 length:375 start_codon:yes stop_codon:yes gene_type:complete